MRAFAHVLPPRLFGLVSCLAAALAVASCQVMPQGRSAPEPVQAAPAPTPPPPPVARPVVTEPAQIPAPALVTPGPRRSADGKVRIGLLLPLSGPQGTLGRSLLEAAQLAVFDLADERFILVVRDTGVTRESAIAAAESVLGEGVELILGPLQGVFTSAVAPVAQRAGVNILSFSNDAKVAADGIYLLGAAPEEQVSRVVSYAAERGLKRLAALVTDDAYGALVARTIRDAATRVGVEIVAIEATNASGEDLSRQVRELTRYDERRAKADKEAAAAAANEEGAEQRRPPEMPPPPFEAVLLGAGIERAREFATYLVHYEAGAPGIRLLGTSLWAVAGQLADRPMQGAWFAGVLPETRQRFEARFRQTFGHDPARLASLAYDATAIAALLARNSAAPDYRAAALLSPHGFIGAEGLFRFRRDGIAERALAVFEITSVGPVMVSEPPAHFEASN